MRRPGAACGAASGAIATAPVADFFPLGFFVFVAPASAAAGRGFGAPFAPPFAFDPFAAATCSVGSGALTDVSARGGAGFFAGGSASRPRAWVATSGGTSSGHTMPRLSSPTIANTADHGTMQKNGERLKLNVQLMPSSSTRRSGMGTGMLSPT